MISQFSFVLLFIIFISLFACGDSKQECTNLDRHCIQTKNESFPIEKGCGDTQLLKNPTLPSQTGPWSVGVRTIQINTQTIEMWYPSLPNEQKGKKKERYDVRLFLPKSEQNKIPEDEVPWQKCECFRDLGIDTDHGPFPVILFLHGTAGFRTQSLSLMTHWASRGFVVLAADHPGIMLSDVLQLKFGPNQANDATSLLSALQDPSEKHFSLSQQMDLTRIAIVGHSAGGMALKSLTNLDNVRVIIPMAAEGDGSLSIEKSTLVLGAIDDKVVSFQRQIDGYETSQTQKRLIGLKNAGHLAFSDLCTIGQEQGGMMALASKHDVTIPSMFRGLFETLSTDGCRPGQLSFQKSKEIIQYATSAVLEETLHCQSTRTTQFTEIQSLFPEIGDYRESKQTRIQ